MKTHDFFYELPRNLIAQEPIAERQLSRLMVMDRKSGAITHRHFFEIPEYLHHGDCLVINDTRVIPARLIGQREDTGGRIELLLVKPIGRDSWEVMAKPGKRAVPGSRFIFGDGSLRAEITGFTEQDYRSAVFEYEGDFDSVLKKTGNVPLPPYIKKQLNDSERYQTVYSSNKGSVAAPTAGLHFTDQLIKDIESAGVMTARLTLHVGPGTFRPVDAEDIKDHMMHPEYYIINDEACDRINKARGSGNRVIAVGTTSCRVLETVSDSKGYVRKNSGWTDIFIYPGYVFKTVDALITNFHLPESTLMMLVSGLAGLENIKAAYNAAIENGYRFFSFGDAMLIY